MVVMHHGYVVLALKYFCYMFCSSIKHLYFGLVSAKDIVSWSSSRCNFASYRKEAVFFNPSKQAILVQSFSDCTVMNFNI